MSSGHLDILDTGFPGLFPVSVVLGPPVPAFSARAVCAGVFAVERRLRAGCRRFRAVSGVRVLGGEVGVVGGVKGPFRLRQRFPGCLCPRWDWASDVAGLCWVLMSSFFLSHPRHFGFLARVWSFASRGWVFFV
jgi:hypothetical protein